MFIIFSKLALAAQHSVHHNREEPRSKDLQQEIRDNDDDYG